jgi:spermidine synthase
VLIVEVLAVRVLSPFYGNTIFTVSSVISVILLALSVGYYAGGVLADRRPSLVWFFSIILASGLLLLLLHFVGTLILPAVSGRLSLELGPLISAALLFLLPAVLLGTLSPFAVKLQSIHVPAQGVGSVAGRIFFWSTLGSITGSLLAGFVLIPRFGVDRILIANGVLLSALGLLPLIVLGVRGKRLYGALAAMAILTAAPSFAVEPVTQGEKVIYRKDGVYQRITIYDGEYYGRPTRFFLLDRSESGAMFLDSGDPTDLVYDYTKNYGLFRLFTPDVRNALVLGGGAYSIPKAILSELPNASVDVAEIEPSFFELAKHYFGAADTPRLHNYVQDGRRFLHDADKSYDLIFGDVYFSYFSVPPHFTTREFFELARHKLSPGGVFVANMIGDLSRQQPSLIMAEIRTFKSVFPNSYFLAVDSPVITSLVQNITLVGYNSGTRIDLLSEQVARHRDPLIRLLPYKVLDIDRRYELSAYPMLTDDYSPVEYLTARALQRSLGGPGVIDGNEIRAVVDQQLRYGSRAIPSAGHEKLRGFLRAEISALAQETHTQTWSRTTAPAAQLTNVMGRFFSSEERRAVVTASYDASTAGAAVLIELARYLINSPVVPQVGVDIVFLDGAQGEGERYFSTHLDELYGSAAPISVVSLDGKCGDQCSPERLKAIAQATLDSLNQLR